MHAPRGARTARPRRWWRPRRSRALRRRALRRTGHRACSPRAPAEACRTTAKDAGAVLVDVGAALGFRPSAFRFGTDRSVDRCIVARAFARGAVPVGRPPLATSTGGSDRSLPTTITKVRAASRRSARAPGFGPPMREVVTEEQRQGLLVGAARRYRLDRVVGQGGMGVVRAATQTVTGKACALKFLKASRAADPRSQETSSRERPGGEARARRQARARVRSRRRTRCGAPS